MRKLVFIKWLAAQVGICFFRNTIQLELHTKYRAKVNFVLSDIELMWQHLKCHRYNCQHFILKLMSFCFKVLIFCRFTVETDEILLYFFSHFSCQCSLLHLLESSENLFRGYKQAILGRDQWTGISKGK